MSAARLRTKVKRLSRELEGSGFVPVKSLRLERRREFVTQLIQFAVIPRADQFELVAGWRFEVVPELAGEATAEAYRWVSRHGFVDRSSFHRWEMGNHLDAEFEAARLSVLQNVVPFLDRFQTIAEIVGGYEAREMELDTAFSPWPAWSRFHLASCYRHLGRIKEALQRYRFVFDEYHDQSLPRKFAQLAIIALEKEAQPQQHDAV